MKSVTRSQKKSWKEIKTITCTTLGIAILSLSLVGCAGLIHLCHNPEHTDKSHGISSSYAMLHPNRLHLYHG